MKFLHKNDILIGFIISFLAVFFMKNKRDLHGFDSNDVRKYAFCNKNTGICNEYEPYKVECPVGAMHV